MKRITLSLLALVWISACTGHENKPLASQHRSTDRVVVPLSNLQGTWQLRSKFTWTKSSTSQRGRDETLLLPPCDLDDIELFSGDGKWALEEGETKCQLLDPVQLVHGDWWASGRDSLFVLYNDGELIRYQIQRLTDSTMTRYWSLHHFGKQLLIEEQLVRIQRLIKQAN